MTASAANWLVPTCPSSICFVRIEFWAILVLSIALSAMLPVAIVLAAISADTIVPFTIFAEVTELAASLAAVTCKFPK